MGVLFYPGKCLYGPSAIPYHVQ